MSPADLNQAMRNAIENARRVLTPKQFARAMQRFSIIWPLASKNLSGVTFKGKTNYSRSVARAADVSERSTRRWRLEFESVFNESDPREAFMALVRQWPGPDRGTKLLDNSMKAFLLDCWINRQLTRKQTCRALREHLEAERQGAGADHRVPSDSTVRRFINAPEPYGLGGDSNPLRGGGTARRASPPCPRGRWPLAKRGCND